MRIGIDASALAVGFTGIHRYTEQLLHGLARVDTRNEYVLYRLSNGAKSPALGPRFEEDRRRLPLKRWVERGFLLGAGKTLDLFHGTNYWAPLLQQYPSVLTVHDLTVHMFPERHPRARRLAHRVLPTLCRRAARIIADSQNTKRDLVRCYQIAPERIEVVYLAAGDEFRPIGRQEDLEAARVRYGLPEEFVLYVGSIEPRKNLPLLIQTMAALRREGLRRSLVIAGDGDANYVAGLREIVAREGLELGRDVVFTGKVEATDLPLLYNLCDVFVYPSVYEGFGLPPLEAMACGTPTIVPSNSSFTELYQGCALFAKLDPPQGLADSIRESLASATLRDELIGRGLELAQSRSWDDTAAETLEVYRRAASQPRVRSFVDLRPQASA